MDFGLNAPRQLSLHSCPHLTFNPINSQTYCIVEWFKKPLSFRLIKILRQIVEFYMQLTNTCQILSEILNALQMEVLVQNMFDIVRMLRRLLYHPLLDGIIEKRDIDIDNLVPYMDLIGESQFASIISKIKQALFVAYQVSEISFKIKIREQFKV